MNAGDPFQWWYEIPFISRAYTTAAFATTTLVALDLIRPLLLYFSWGLVLQGEVWRLLTTFLFFGSFGVDFLFHMYFLSRYSRLLEEGEFHGRRADFAFFLLLGAIFMVLASPWVPNLPFLGNSLAFMMVYVWGRRNEHVRMSLMGLLPFTAPYMPYVLLVFSLCMSHTASFKQDLLGIAAGHVYYFCAFVYPEVAAIRGWRLQRIVRTPALLKVLCGEGDWQRFYQGDVIVAPDHADGFPAAAGDAHAHHD